MGPPVIGEPLGSDLWDWSAVMLGGQIATEHDGGVGLATHHDVRLVGLAVLAVPTLDQLSGLT